MKSFVTLLLSAIVSINAFSQQTDKDAIKQTINTLFNGMRNGDTSMLRTAFAKDMILQSISTKADGQAVLTTEKADDFVAAIGKPHQEVYDEKVVYNDIKIDGDLASVWAPYKFYLGKQFSHCGVDVFQLIRTKTGWKIIYIVDTRRKDNCPE